MFNSLSMGLTVLIFHIQGAFLPFHRLLIHAHEYLLEAECGYTGGQPYDSPSSSDVSTV